jgi:hypothetical protein
MRRRAPGRCVFCGEFGLTKEHVLPDWLRSIFPRSPTDTHTVGNVDWVHLPTVGVIPLPSRRLRQGQAGSRKVKVVCKGCNTGWLSVMEESTKPILSSLVQGTAGVLTNTRQRALAAWIAKTTMTAEFLMPKQTSLKQAEREDFRLRREPGDHWRIWIAYYLGNQFVQGSIFHQGVGVCLPPRPVRHGVTNTQYTVIFLGRLLVIALSSEEDQLSYGIDRRYQAVIRQIWPLRGDDINWPPAGGVDDRGADVIMRVFAKLIGLEMPPSSPWG